jgi:hypothetical protein
VPHPSAVLSRMGGTAQTSTGHSPIPRRAPSIRSFIADGWDSTNLNRPFSDPAPCPILPQFYRGWVGQHKPQPAILRSRAVPHPSAVLSRMGGTAQTSTGRSPIPRRAPSIRSIIADGWDSTNLNRPISDPAAHPSSRFWDLGICNPSSDRCTRLRPGGAQ